MSTDTILQNAADVGDYLTAQGLMDMEIQSHEMAAGIKLNATGAPGMIADLQAMNETVLEKVPLGFEMYDVLTERDLQDFKRVLIEGYDMPTGMAEGWVQSTHGFGIGKTPWNMVLGRLNGEPVVTNIILKDAGVVGVYGISVTPPARGKGIGAAITLQPLLDARDREGYNYAVLFSTEMGLPVYKRIGFRTTDVRINRYLWREG